MSDNGLSAASADQGGPESKGSNEGGPESDDALPPLARYVIARRLNGGAAAVLILEAIAVLFVPRAIAQSGPGLTPARFSAVLAVVALLIVVAGLQRRSWGPRAGLAVQVPVLGIGFFTPAMWFLGLLFLFLWIYLMRIRGELLAATPPGGPTEDER